MREGYLAQEIDRALYALNILSSALVKQADVPIHGRSLTARQALDEICAMHEPETEGTKVELLNRLLRITVPRTSPPTPALVKHDGLAARRLHAYAHEAYRLIPHLCSHSSSSTFLPPCTPMLRTPDGSGEHGPGGRSSPRQHPVQHSHTGRE